MSKNLIYFFSLRIILVTLTAAIILGCAEDKPSEPENNTNEENIVASAAIGSEGGTIAGDGIKIDIPPGAFSETQNLLIQKEDSSIFDDGVVTETFRLGGFPTAISNPIRVAIRHNGNLDEESLILFSDIVYDELFDVNITSYKQVEAKDSSDFLVASIPRVKNGNNNIEKVYNITDEIIFGVILGKSQKKPQTYSSDHFILTYPEKFYSLVPEAILSNLWEKYYKFLSDSCKMKLSDSGAKIWNIVIGPAEKRSDWYILLKNEPEIDFLMNSSKLEKEGLNSIFTWWVFNALYTRSLRYYYTDMSRKVNWLSSAIRVWSNKYLNLSSAMPNVIFSVFSNPKAPFNGLEAGIINVNPYAPTKEYHSHGIGMSSLVKYLLEFKLNNQALLNKENLGNVFDLIKNGSNQTEALLSAINLPAEEWWPDFFRHYISGEIIDLKGNAFIDSEILDGTWTPTFNYDSFQILNSLPDLSAKLFTIELQDSEPSPSTALSITLNSLSGEKAQGLTALVFAYNNGKLDLFRRGQNISISNIKGDYIDKNINKFLVVIVNSNRNKNSSKPYTDIANFSLSMHLDAQTEFTECYFDFDIAVANYDIQYEDGSSDKVPGLGDFSDYFDLTYDGSTYSGNLVERYQIGGDSIFTDYNISFMLNDLKSMVKEMIVEIKSNTKSAFSTTDEYREGTYRLIEFANIPLLSGFNDRFEVRGDAVCDGNYLISFEGSTFYVDYSQSTLSDWICDNTSRIYLDLD